MAFDAGTIEATLTLNRNPFTAGLAAARSQARGMERERFKVSVGIDVDQRQMLNAQAQLRTFAAKNVRAVARVVVERLAFDKLLLDLKAFDKSRYSATVDVDTSGARAQIDLLEQRMRNIRDRTVELNGATRAFGDGAERDFGRGASRFQRLATIIIALSPLIASALSATVGVVGTLVSALAIAGVGAAAFAAVAIPTFMEIKKAVAAGQGEIDKLPPALRNAAMAMQEMNTTYFKLVEANRERVGEVMAGSFRVATQVLNQMQPVITAAADGFRRMNDIASEFFADAEFKEYVAFLSEAVAPTMQRLTQITFYFFAAFGNLTEAFYRFGGSRILDQIVAGFRDFSNWTDKLGQNETFLRFMESMERSLPVVGALLRELLEFIINLTIGLEPLGSMIASVLTTIFNALNQLPPELMAGITVAFAAMWAAIALGAAGPVGVAIGLIAGLSVVLADLVTRNESVRTALADTVGEIRDRFTPTWDGLVGSFNDDVVPAFDGATAAMRDHLLPVLNDLWDKLDKDVIPAVERLAGTFTEDLLPSILDFWRQVQPFVAWMTGVFGEEIVGTIEFIAQAFESGFTFITGILTYATGVWTGDWQKMGEGLTSITEAFWMAIGALFSMNLDEMQITYDQWDRAITTAWNDFWNGLGETFNGWGVEINNNWVSYWGGMYTTQSGSQIRMEGDWNAWWRRMRAGFDEWSNSINQAWYAFWDGVGAYLLEETRQMNNDWVSYWGGMYTTQSGSQIRMEGEWNAWWRRLNDRAIQFNNDVTTGWNNFWTGIFTNFNNWGIRVNASWNTFWTDLWNRFNQWAADINAGWNRFWAGFFDVASQGVAKVGDAFRRIANLFRDPINWVINVVLNDGILGAWNTVMGWIGQPALRAGRIPELPRFERGGPIQGGIPGKDSVPILTMPGEYVLSKRAVAGLGGVNRVEQIHNAARVGRLDGLGATRSDGRARQALMRAVPADDAIGRAFAYGGVQPHVARAGDEINSKFGPFAGGIGGVGGRPNASDHPSGHALDFMTMRNVAQGHKVADYMVQNAKRLLVKYLIWQQQINKGAGWVGMENRGSPTANHMDHVHASFLNADGSGKGFSGMGSKAVEVSWWSQLAGQVTGLLNGLMPAAIPGLGGPVGEAALRIPRGIIDRTIQALQAKLSNLFTTIFGGGGAAASGPVVEQVRAVAARYGWDQGAQWSDLSSLIAKESSWNPNAANPTSSARGLFQKMTSLHGPVESTATGQAEWGLNYIRSKYGSPSAAWAFHRRNNWYENGGWLMPGEGAYNETREPEAIFNRPQLSAIHRAIDGPGSGGSRDGLSAEEIRAIVAGVVEELGGGDTYNVMLPERATLRDFANHMDHRKKVVSKGRYTR